MAIVDSLQSDYRSSRSSAVGAVPVLVGLVIFALVGSHYLDEATHLDPHRGYIRLPRPRFGQLLHSAGRGHPG